MSTAVAVPRFAFIKAWEWWAPTPPPPVIGADTFWLNDTAKAVVETKVNEALARVGLIQGGAPTPRFRHVLTVLSRPEREISGWIAQTQTGDTGGILVAAAGRYGIRVVRDETMVVVEEIPPTDLIELFADVLPDVPPARIPDLVVPVSRYANPRDEAYEFDMQTRHTGPDPAATMRELVNAPRSGLHQIYAAVTGRSGRRLRSNPLTAIDLTDRGRILTFVTSHGPRREAEISCVPGGRRDLVEILHATHKALIGV